MTAPAPVSGPVPLTASEASEAPTWRAAYSDRTAVLMAKLAGYAYLPLAPDGGCAQLEALLAGGGFRLLGTFARDDSQGFVAINDKELAVLAFRGTANLGDFEIDFDAALIDMPGRPGVRAHRGFWTCFEATHAEVRALVDQVPANVGLYITGHSLGGALAQIAAAAFERDNLAACYSFGSPRVATLIFDDLVKCPHYRLVDNWDLVPGVPPPFRFQHTGDPRLLLKGFPGRIFRRDRQWPAWLFANVLALLKWPLSRGETSIIDHELSSYLARLQLVREARARRRGAPPPPQPCPAADFAPRPS